MTARARPAMRWRSRRRARLELRLLGHSPQWHGCHVVCTDCARAWGGDVLLPGNLAATIRSTGVCRGRGR